MDDPLPPPLPFAAGTQSSSVDALSEPASAVPSARVEQEMDGDEAYYPLSVTLRLYAGWLLLWYGVVFALGAYQNTRKLPVTLNFINQLATSHFFITFAFGVFLYLLLAGLRGRMRGGMLVSTLFVIVGVMAVFVFHINT